MDLVEYKNSKVILSFSEKEFNFFREVLRELPRSLGKEELPTLTGYTREQVFDLADKMIDIAEKLDIEL